MHYAPFTQRNRRVFQIPIVVPEGTRISASVRHDTLSITTTPRIRVAMWGYQTTPYDSIANQKITSHGTTFDVSNTVATAIDPGSTADTYGGITPLESSLACDILLMTVNVIYGYNVASFARWAYDILKGPSIAGVTVVEALDLFANTSNDDVYPCTRNLMYVSPVLAGQRLAADAKCSITTATPRVFQLQILGWGGD